MKWSGPSHRDPEGKNRYELPGDPGPLTELFWALEDWWRFLHPMQKATIALVVLATAFWILVTRV